jgi:hypothetical protein
LGTNLPGVVAADPELLLELLDVDDGLGDGDAADAVSIVKL